MKIPKLILFIAVILVAVTLGIRIFQLSKKTQDLKLQYSEINNIKYGLFSINQWKNQLSEIINSEIGDLDIKENEKQIKPLIEAQLNELIDGVYKKIADKNRKSFKGSLKQAFINTFIDIKDIKEGIPQYADSIIKTMEKPKNRNKLTGVLLDKVEDYFNKTFEVQDLSTINSIIMENGATDVADARIKLDQHITENQLQLARLSWLLISLSILLFVISGFNRVPLSSLQYILLVTILFILLFTGVSTPMIDLEAKISEMSFILFDHPVQFVNQILYFQSKSVVDVFQLMITHPDLQMKVVGLLMVAFSIVFPVLKLISSVGYYYNHWSARDNKLVQFFVLKSGKWSMTDVMIIAIFMAYIGFNGIISSQFGKLHSASEEIVLLTTNGTSLQPGFYLFLAYAILALFLSEFLSARKPEVKAPLVAN